MKSLCVIVMALCLTACGGTSPTSPSVEEAAPPAVVLKASLSTLSPEASSYYRPIAEFNRRMIIRGESPLKVSAPEWDPTVVRLATNFWEEVTQGKAQFQIVDDPLQAHAVLKFAEIAEGFCAIYQTNNISRTGLVILTNISFRRQPASCSEARVIAHELGHTLIGLLGDTKGHTPTVYGDVMMVSAVALASSPVLREVANFIWSYPPGTPIID